MFIIFKPSGCIQLECDFGSGMERAATVRVNANPHGFTFAVIFVSCSVICLN